MHRYGTARRRDGREFMEMKKLLCLWLVCAMLLAFAACSNDLSGTFYSESGDLYIELRAGLWFLGETDGEEALSGPYVVENGRISFQLVFEDGEARESFSGEISGDRLVMNFTGEAGTTVFYRDGRKGLLSE